MMLTPYYIMLNLLVLTTTFLTLTTATQPTVENPTPVLPPHPLLPTTTRQSFTLTTLPAIKSAINDQDFPPTHRRRVITATRTILSDINPFRQLHLNYLRTDPLTKLNQLSNRLSSISNWDFHMNMIAIFQSLDDSHTVYYPPEPLRSAYAASVKPITTFFHPPSRKPRYYAGNNVTVISVDGQNVHAHAAQLAKKGYASNKASQTANGVNALTTRFLAYDAIPRKDSVMYRITNGKKTVTQVSEWKYYALSPAAAAAANEAVLRRTASKGGDSTDYLVTSITRRPTMRAHHTDDVLSMAPVISEKNSTNTTMRFQTPYVTRQEGTTVTPVFVSPLHSHIFEAFVVTPPSSPSYGLLRLKSFATRTKSEIDAVTMAIADTLQNNLPPNRLAIDLRGNEGGTLALTRNVHDLLTSKNISPMPVMYRGSYTMRRIATERHVRMEPFRTTARLMRPAVKSAHTIGEQFTGVVTYLLGYKGVYDGLETYPRIPQKFSGVLAVITDAHTYSAGDTFAAWMYDGGVATVVGVDGATGGGGATVADYERWFRQPFAGTFGREKLPLGIEFSTSYERVFRSGAKAGAVLENFGVRPHKRYYPTKRDRDEEDADLWKFMGKVLDDRET